MQPLIARRETWVPKPVAAPQKADPAPSRAQYRWARFWMVPMYRRLVRTGLPLALTGVLVLSFLSNEGNREAVSLQIAAIKRSVTERPEFRVSVLEISGATQWLADEIREQVPIRLPVSSFDLDLAGLQDQVSALPAVQSAEVRLSGGGVLEIAVVERVPALVWRSDHEVALLGEDGVRLMAVSARLARPDLPLITGAGADRAAPEALELLAAAGPMEARIRGLVRVGERRWDIIIAPDIRILLPEANARKALDHVLALDEAQHLLSRDIVAIDLRNPERPTLRLAAPPPPIAEPEGQAAPATEDNDT